jgi:tetrahydromethanopterin S-methyltransferase subunit G
MSVIEDSRKVLQDFIAPELRAISARLDALEKKTDDNERRAEKRHDDVMGAIRQVIDYNSIQQRLARLESKEGAHQ